MSIAAPAAENHVVPPAASSSWRTWLMTGTRQGQVYRRRVRGAHKGLKRMLLEGMGDGVEAQTNCRGFSGSLVRQAVRQALIDLPPAQPTREARGRCFLRRGATGRGRLSLERAAVWTVSRNPGRPRDQWSWGSRLRRRR